MKTVIIGKGGMGKSFARTVSGADISYVGREGGETELADADCIVIATPPSSSDDIIRRLDGLTDKLLVVLWSYMGHGAKLTSLNLPILYVHPMYGPDITTLTSQNVIIAGETEHKIAQHIRSRFEKLGANITLSNPKEHDELMSLIQCLSQFNSIAFSMSLEQSGYSREQFYNFASVTFRLNRYAIERIMSQKPELWAELQFENEHFKTVLEQHQANTKLLADAVLNKDEESFKQTFNKAANLWRVPEAIVANPVKQDVVNSSQTITLGPAGTYSDQASRQYLAGDTPSYAKTIQEALLNVANGSAEQAIVPFENSIQGVVIETLDTLHQQALIVTDELTLDIHHSLCGLEESIDPATIKTVYSHPQALGQSRRYLREHFPQAELVPTTSTAAAMQIISDQKDMQALAIGPQFAADMYKLKTIERSIEDEAGNQTRFFVVAKEPKAVVLPFVFLALMPSSDQPGLLHDLLTIFKQHGINLSQIESRPSRVKLGLYVFYIRLDLPSNDPRNEIIIKQIEANKIEVMRMSS